MWKALRWMTMTMAVAAAFALGVPSEWIDFTTSEAFAADSGGHGGSGGGQGGQQGSHGPGGRQGSASGGKAVPSAGGRPDSTGGDGGGSDAKLGRLSMARAYLSPGFDPTKIDDPEAPLAQLDLYKTSLEENPNAVTLESLAVALSHVATAPLSEGSIVKLNDLLGVTDQFEATNIDAGDLADRVNVLVKESRDEGEE